MQVSFELAPVAFLAPNDEVLEDAFFLLLFESLGHGFEVMHGLIPNAALGMAAIVSAPAITPATARQIVEQSFALGEFIQPQVEQPCSLTVHQSNAKPGLRPQQRCQWLQVETPIHEDLRAGQLGRQVEFAPEVPCSIRKNCLCPSLISAQIAGDIQNAMQGCAHLAILAVLLRLFNSVAHQVFGQNGLLAMRLVLRRLGLKIKAKRATWTAC